MASDVATLERRARALRDELASRDVMLEAVQTQCKLDVESAREERDAANARATPNPIPRVPPVTTITFPRASNP